MKKIPVLAPNIMRKAATDPNLNLLIISHALIAYFISSKQWVQRGKSPIQAHLPYQKDILCL